MGLRHCSLKLQSSCSTALWALRYQKVPGRALRGPNRWHLNHGAEALYQLAWVPRYSVWSASEILGLLPGYWTLYSSRVVEYVFFWSTARGKRNGDGCSFYTSLNETVVNSHCLLLPWKFQPAPPECTYNHQITNSPGMGMCCRLLSGQLGPEEDEQCCTPVMQDNFSVPALGAACECCLRDIKFCSPLSLDLGFSLRCLLVTIHYFFCLQYTPCFIAGA